MLSCFCLTYENERNADAYGKIGCMDEKEQSHYLVI